MNWYYAEEQTQKGPFTEEDFQNLVQQGVIRDDTLVWREGLGDWKPYAELQGAGRATTVAVGEAETCSVCGRPFPAQDLVQVNHAYVCAACKPVFLQKIKEDASVPRQMEYAGFWIRWVASLIDWLILNVPFYILYFGIFFLMGAMRSSEQMQIVSVMQLLLSLLYLIVMALYTIILTAKYGATLGKMAVKIKVVTAEGERISYGRSTGRFFARLLSKMILYIGCIIAAFDREKRGLHDLICDTRVIRRS